MTLLHAILLGALQGLTEFLPISSDGHLSLLQPFLAVDLGGREFLAFEIVLHAGSLLALLLCYGRTWWELATSPFTGEREKQRLLLALALATVPGVVAGLLFEDALSGFRSPAALGVGFIVTASVLVAGERFAAASKDQRLSIGFLPALLVGVAQALALLPSLSRSGLTVSAGRLAGLSRRQALDFSFLMAAPILAGAVMLVSLRALSGEVSLPPANLTVAGFLSSLGVSLVTVLTLRRAVARFPLSLFAWYLVPLGLLCLIALR